jgi:hypothetical protein
VARIQAANGGTTQGGSLVAGYFGLGHLQPDPEAV